MSIEYTAAPTQSYQAYLAGHYLKQNIDIALAKDIRVLVGSVDEIFKRNTRALTDALRDFRYFLSGPNAHFEVISVNLWNICNSLGALNANAVNGFQALFVKADEAGAMFLGADSGAAGETVIGPTAVGDPYPAVLDLIRHERFSEALAALGADERPPAVKDAHRVDQLRGLLLAGVPGQPKSAALVDLGAAEAAFLAAAARARNARPQHAIQAYLAAGKAAYAANRFFDAQGHYLAALKVDPTCGEANYQMARLLVHEGRDASAQAYFHNALDLHWSFALRAASDELFITRRHFVRKCLRIVTRRISREAHTIGRACVFDLKFLRQCEDGQYRLDRLKSLEQVKAEVATVSAPAKAAVLKSAFDCRKVAKAAQVGVRRLANEYCNLLRAAEYDITRRFVKRPLRRSHSDLARPLVAFASPAINMTVVMAIAAGAHALAICESGDWPVRAGLGFAALVCAWLAGCVPRATAEAYLYRVFLPIVAFTQACAIEVRLRANRFSINYRRARLRCRVRQIERLFELSTRAKAGQGALS